MVRVIFEAKKNTPLKLALRDKRVANKADGSVHNPIMVHDTSDDYNYGNGIWRHIHATTKDGSDSYGSLSYYFNGKNTHVDRMDVRSAFRRKGVGTKLVRELHRLHKVSGRSGKVIYGDKTPDGQAFHKSNTFAKS